MYCYFRNNYGSALLPGHMVHCHFPYDDTTVKRVRSVGKVSEAIRSTAAVCSYWVIEWYRNNSSVLWA